MTFGKEGVLGEGVVNIYRMVVITLIAVVILGLSAVFYQYYVDVRDSEATIFSRQIFDCVSNSGVVDLDSVLSSESLLDYCGFEGIEGIYMSLEFYNSSRGKIIEFKEGDSSVKGIYSLFIGPDSGVSEKIKKYEPGHVFMGSDSQNYYGPLTIIYKNNKIKGGMILNVYTKGEL